MQSDGYKKAQGFIQALFCINPLDFNAFVDGHDAQSQVFKLAAAESGQLHAINQFPLRWEFPDAFDEVLIAFAVFRDDFAHFGDQLVGIGVIEF